LVVDSPRGEIEARAKVTNRVRPLKLGDRTVHQICLPWHFGTFTSSEQGVVGDTVNDLIAISGDPNVSIHESKAFSCGVRAGRRNRETTERLAGAHLRGAHGETDRDHPSERPERASQTGQSVFRPDEHRER
jgi:formate dehydrogenase major subunit